MHIRNRRIGRRQFKGRQREMNCNLKRIRTPSNLSSSVTQTSTQPSKPSSADLHLLVACRRGFWSARTILTVPPLSHRPSIGVDGGRAWSEDDIDLEAFMEMRQPPGYVNVDSTYIDNIIAGEVRTTRQVDSRQLVITGDRSEGDEVGVPWSMNLTYRNQRHTMSAICMSSFVMVRLHILAPCEGARRRLLDIPRPPLPPHLHSQLTILALSSATPPYGCFVLSALQDQKAAGSRRYRISRQAPIGLAALIRNFQRWSKDFNDDLGIFNDALDFQRCLPTFFNDVFEIPTMVSRFSTMVSNFQR
ncbi:hypothetical protein C8F01DRAFT_1236162 [Mycena amicta]|nr:hypothetical protein C8F01DRAFT_1236162 [Mycena amicta]